MAIIGVKTGILDASGKASGLRTGLIWWTQTGSGAQESNKQVLATDASTGGLGRAQGVAANAVPALVYAANDRVDATGI